MNGRPLDDFKPGDEVKYLNDYLTTGGERDINDTYTVIEINTNYEETLGVVNNRTGHSYVMSSGEYDFI